MQDAGSDVRDGALSLRARAPSESGRRDSPARRSCVSCALMRLIVQRIEESFEYVNLLAAGTIAGERSPRRQATSAVPKLGSLTEPLRH
jgi:hypothetical protein